MRIIIQTRFGIAGYPDSPRKGTASLLRITHEAIKSGSEHSHTLGSDCSGNA